MPIYAYRCESCGHAQDVLQKISDPLLTQCPACGAASFTKQVTAAGFQLKGTGWYVTDFRGGNSNSGGKAATEGVKEGSAPPASTPAPADAGSSASTSASASPSSSSGGASDGGAQSGSSPSSSSSTS